MPFVKDIMSDKVVTVAPETPIIEVAAILLEHRFNGVPVVDADQKLLGLITEFDLISEKLLLRLAQLSPEDIKKALIVTAGDVMEKHPVTLLYDALFEDALEVFNKHRMVNPIPVIDQQGKLVGIISRFDLVKLIRVYNIT